MGNDFAKNWTQADDFSMGGFVANQLAEAYRHFEESRKQYVKSSLQVVSAKSELPRKWSKYAKTAGKYEALSEACNDELAVAIRENFFSALNTPPAEQAAELTTIIDSSYQKQRDARQKAGKLCNNSQLKTAQKKYLKIVTEFMNGDL